MSKNCGHKDFGRIDTIRDLESKKNYWCEDCNKSVSKNCGHYYFGNEFYVRDSCGEYYC